MSIQSFNQNTLSYLNYLKKTLGVTKVLNLKSDLQIAAKPFDAEVDLGFFILGYESYTKAEHELLQKMISAMKLQPDQFFLTDINNLNSIQTHSKIQIYFVDDPISDEQTYSPRILLLYPEFKKQAWDFLKRFANI